MAEIYRDSIGKAVTFSIPANEATVTAAKFIRAGEETAGQTTVVNLDTMVQLPYSVTRYDGKFDVEWTFSINGTSYTKRDTHEVVTPLFTAAELRAFDKDFNAPMVSDQQIRDLEWMIRSLFETLTGQSYGLENGVLSFNGNGGSTISLPKRSIEPQGPLFGDGPGRAVVTNDGWVLSGYKGESWVDKFEPDRLLNRPNRYLEGQRYYVKGLWGYYSVPEDIKLAAMTLAQDYGCEQSIWRDRYLRAVSAADMRYDMDGRAFIKTGNVKVDQILDRFARVRMVVL